MTNEMIIFNNSISLMEAGILKGTGEYITVEMEDGSKKTFEVPEEIHTFNGWKARGYMVKKGEKSNIKFDIWKYSVKKKKGEEEREDEEKQVIEVSTEKGRMFWKTSYFFTASQVKKI